MYLLSSFLAQADYCQTHPDECLTPTSPAKEIVGSVTNPLPSAYANLPGIVVFLTNVLRLVFVVAGMFAFFNLVIAGFQYMSAGGDAKALGAAWARIWQSLIGLVIIVGSFALAALFGYLIFGNPAFILNPVIYGPK